MVFSKLISVDEALTILKDHSPKWAIVDTSIENSVGRVLAEDIIASFDLPSESVSVMDGYAFKQTDINGVLKVIGESRAGEPFDGEVNDGEAIRIFTGAILPKGADAVEIQEHADYQGARLKFTELSIGRTYIRPSGSDFKTGDILLGKGHKITPVDILALASANRATFKTYKMPSVAIIRAGDELAPVGSLIGYDKIIDSNGPGLRALLTSWGITVTDLGLASDNPDDIVTRFRNCNADIIVPIGGASVGDYDFMRTAFINEGFEIQFSKVAVKPGKPTWLAKRGHQLVLGLPGNPSSAWVCAHIFLKELIGIGVTRESFIAGAPLHKNGTRETYLRAKFSEANTVVPLGIQDSGLVTPLSSADILIRRKIKADKIEANDVVECIRL